VITHTKYASGEGTPLERSFFEHVASCRGCTPDGRTLCWEGRTLARAVEEGDRRAAREASRLQAVRRFRGRV
jgi:hypothetical protein